MKKLSWYALLAVIILLVIIYLLPTSIKKEINRAKLNNIVAIDVQKSNWKGSETVSVKITKKEDIDKFISLLEDYDIRRSVQQRMVLNSALYRVYINTVEYEDSVDMKFDINDIEITKIGRSQMYKVKENINTEEIDKLIYKVLEQNE